MENRSWNEPQAIGVLFRCTRTQHYYLDFLTWLLIGWQLCCQPIRGYVWKFRLTSMDFNVEISYLSRTQFNIEHISSTLYGFAMPQFKDIVLVLDLQKGCTNRQGLVQSHTQVWRHSEVNNMAWEGRIRYQGGQELLHDHRLPWCPLIYNWRPVHPCAKVTALFFRTWIWIS